MADKPAPELVRTEPRPSTPLERIRYVPEWEVPVNPPQRPFFSRVKLSRSLKRSRLTPAIRPKPQTARKSPRSSFAPDSKESLHKESLISGGILPTARSTFSIKTSPSTHHQSVPTRIRKRFDAILPTNRRYLCGLTRKTCICLSVALALIIFVALGLGLGLGLRGRTSDKRRLPLPDGTRRSYDGDLTFFSPALGACGLVNTDNDAITAVAWELFDAAGPNLASGGNPNQNPLCGKRIRVTRYIDGDPGKGNATVDVTVVDRCTGCKPTDLDLSPSVFGELAKASSGRVKGSWHWL